jgi:hypothetical protein
MISFDLNKLRSPDYWFAGAAGSYADVPVIDKTSDFFSLYIDTFSFLFILGLILGSVSLFSKSNFPLIKKLSLWGTNFSWMGFLGMFWFSLRETKIAFFGARFWLIIGFAWFAIVFFFIARYFLFYFKIERTYYSKNKAVLNKY